MALPHRLAAPIVAAIAAALLAATAAADGAALQGGWAGRGLPDIPRYTVRLTEPPRQRWSAVLDHFLAQQGLEPFLDFYGAVLAELKSADGAIYAFYEEHLADFETAYSELYPETLEEMRALADALQAQCRNQEERRLLSWPRVFLAQLHMQISNIGPKQGECTSVVIRPTNGSIIHMRNWDFGPRPDALGSASATVDFEEGGEGGRFTCLLALTHIAKWTTCMRPGSFSMSLNARGFGEGHERGRSPAEELRLLRLGHLPRVEVLKRVMQAKSFDIALAAAAEARPLTSMYVILANGGEGPGQSAGGAVVTLMGNGSSADVLAMPPRGAASDADGWFLAQTNVDHWLPVAQSATSSHRREHVKARLRALGPGAAEAELFAILQDKATYPEGNQGPDDGRIFRPSTIASVLMKPAEAAYKPLLWQALPHQQPREDISPPQWLVLQV